MACHRFLLEGYREHPQSCRDVRVIFRSGAEWGPAPVRRNILSVNGHSIHRESPIWVLGRNLQDLVVFLNDLHSKHTNRYLHKQGIDTTTPGGELLFQMLGVFAEFERSMIVERVKAGLKRARAEGKVLGRGVL